MDAENKKVRLICRWPNGKTKMLTGRLIAEDATHFHILTFKGEKFKQPKLYSSVEEV